MKRGESRLMQQIENMALILDNRRLNEAACVLTVEAPGIAAAAQPGQFVNVACNRFLRRPLGIMDADPKTGRIKLGVRIQGDGTRWLSERPAGETLSLLGPLGHGFDLDGLERVITVGGGTGVFPLYFVQKQCQARGIDSLAVCGYRSRTDSILADDYAALTCQTLLASDSGDMDFTGHAGQALEHLLADLPTRPSTAILTCGPKIMMQTVADLAAKAGVRCQVSLEERMACGVGVCLVCACRIKSEADGQPFTHQRCCVEGPVFPAEVVAWSI
jgi:dihydroorotate dehydrogenase electron transfer subunit